MYLIVILRYTGFDAREFPKTMNFLMRSSNNQSVAVEQPSAQESAAVTRHRAPPRPSASLEALIAEDPFPSRQSTVGDQDGSVGGGESGDDFAAESNADRDSCSAAKHSDVSDDQGWITIPFSKLNSSLCCINFFVTISMVLIRHAVWMY